MTTTADDTAPMPTDAEVQALLVFLAANIEVAKADGDWAKARTVGNLKYSVEGLAAHAVDVSAVTTVEIVNRDGYVLEDARLYSSNSTLELRDEGQTLRFIPVGFTG